MKLLVVVSAILAIASAGVVAPIAIASPAILATVPLGQHSSQYHSQDVLGQYSYGYINEQSAKNEIKSADGQTVGSYSYIDAEGKLQNVQYRSDAINGFRVSATNLPVALEAAAVSLPEPITDTPEVVEARAKHFEALRNAEEELKKSAANNVSVEVKSAIHAHPAIITATTPTLIRAAPIVATPTFAYSYGINFGGLQPILSPYAAPGHFIAAPFGAAQIIAANHILPEAPNDLPEVVEARAKHLEAFENVKKSIEEQKRHQDKE